MLRWLQALRALGVLGQGARPRPQDPLLAAFCLDHLEDVQVFCATAAAAVVLMALLYS